jgi:hypothetical protein
LSAMLAYLAPRQVISPDRGTRVPQAMRFA